MKIKVHIFQKEYSLPLEETDLSNEDKLIHENNELREKMKMMEK